MAKNIESIMRDAQAWQEEKKGRAISAFVVDNERGCINVTCGSRQDIIASMAFYIFQDKEIRELVQMALLTAEKMLEEKENEE